MQINGKKYKVDANISWGLFEEFVSNENDPLIMRKIVKEVLKPSPSDKEIKEMNMKQVLKIISTYSVKTKDFLKDFKKKLSI